MGRRKGRVELIEYAAMARRIVRSFGDRFAGEGDEAELRELFLLGEAVDDAMRTAIAHMTSRSEMSWARIGRAVSMSGEGARKRWGDGEFPNGFVVYALRAAGSSEVSYVGQSMRLSLRIAGYRGSASQAGSVAFAEWLAGDGAGFEVDVLERCATQEEVDAAERRWISTLREAGHPLLNVASGGRRPAVARCESTEIRARRERGRRPAEIRCTLPSGHEGVCVWHGTPFGSNLRIAS